MAVSAADDRREEADAYCGLAVPQGLAGRISLDVPGEGIRMKGPSYSSLEAVKAGKEGHIHETRVKKAGL